MSIRIASLLASGTEILYGLGLGDHVVAVSHECDFPAEVAGKPRVTSTQVDDKRASGEIDEQVTRLVKAGQPLYDIDIPKLAELQPDLIVTQSHCDVCAVSYEDVCAAVQTQNALNATKIVDLNPATLDEVFEDILRVGRAATTIERTEEYIARLQTRVDAIQSVSGTLSSRDRPRVVCIEWLDPLMLAANWMPEIIEKAGGQNSLTHSGEHSGGFAWEDVVAYDPEVIFVAPCGFDLPRTVSESRILPTWPGWSELAAVRAGRVWAVDGNAYFNRSGPRLVDSLELLAHLLHPDRVGSPAWVSEQVWARLD